MTEQILLALLVGHYLADFGLQTHEQAIEKYKGAWELVSHVSVYTLVMFLVYLTFDMNLNHAFIFAVITWVSHYVTDVITSNIGKPFWRREDPHNGFVVIGMDQIAHYLQLYITVKFLII